MSLQRWGDDRLDDLANAVQAMRNLPQRVAEHEVRLTAKDKTLERHERLISELDDKIDKQAESLRWTPALKAALIAPTLGSLIAAVALVMTKGAG